MYSAAPPESTFTHPMQPPSGAQLSTWTGLPLINTPIQPAWGPSAIRMNEPFGG
jgi:hypothetical protein